MIYFVRATGTTQVYIGHTSHPNSRVPLEVLANATPEPLEVEATIAGLTGTRRAWERLCQRLTSEGKHVRGHWFQLFPEEVNHIVVNRADLVPPPPPSLDKEDCLESALADESREYGLLPNAANIRTGGLQRAVTALQKAEATVLQAVTEHVAACRAKKKPLSTAALERHIGRVFVAVYSPVAMLHSNFGAADSEERSVVLQSLRGA